MIFADAAVILAKRNIQLPVQTVFYPPVIANGGWRDNDIGQKQPIDGKTTMPDGTQMDGVDSIRQLLLDKPEIFTRCLLVKLLQYGAGRELSVGDQRVVDAIVNATPEGGYHFQDLITAAITSEVFGAK